VVEEDVESVVRANGLDTSGFGRLDERVVRALDGTDIRPKTDGQAMYLESLQEHDIVFAVGPAGTGKTYLAVAAAIASMKRGLYRKLVLVRPAVEAGERLGFLPGDLVEKVSPYLRPLYDALGDIVPFAEVKSYRERDIIEVVPLAFMRGRTLDNAFIILDEGQNTTPAQMKMFLTRMGRHSKVVVTGDVTQTDLARGVRSGLVDAREKLKGIPGIGFVALGRADIVRHPLVQRIVDAYEPAPQLAPDSSLDPEMGA
jgi:phosphate starvation-inducible PhoH-like protein